MALSTAQSWSQHLQQLKNWLKTQGFVLFIHNFDGGTGMRLFFSGAKRHLLADEFVFEGIWVPSPSGRGCCAISLILSFSQGEKGLARVRFI